MSDKTDINSLKSYCCMIIPYIATSHNTYQLSLVVTHENHLLRARISSFGFPLYYSKEQYIYFSMFPSPPVFIDL